MNVSCWAENCRWCEDGWCQKSEIIISCDGDCEDYESYQLSYTDSYWVACLKDGEKYRKLCHHGRRIEYGGYVFFTQDRITDFGDYMLTEERTGVRVCEFRRLQSVWDKFLEKVASYPDVLSLPIKGDEIDEKKDN